MNIVISQQTTVVDTLTEKIYFFAIKWLLVELFVNNVHLPVYLVVIRPYILIASYTYKFVSVR